VADDPRKRHPDYEHTDPPPPKRTQVGKLVIPPKDGGDPLWPQRVEAERRARERSELEQAEAEARVVFEREERASRVEMERGPVITTPSDSGQMRAVKAHWLSQWTPATIVGAVIALVAALGGTAGLKELLASNGHAQTQKLVAEGEARILKELQAERDERRKEIRRLERQVMMSTDLTSQLNGGPAGPGWPYRDIQWEPPPVSGQRLIMHVTSAPWPTREQE
jgi:hypothetical protein